MSKQWRVSVFESDGTTVDFQLTNDHLLEGPRIGGQRIDVLKGTSESVSWSLEVGDFSELVTGEMTDGAGRMVLAGRRVLVEEDDGSGYSDVWGGRLVDIVESDGPGKYSFKLTDEQWIERGVRIYETQDTTRIAPPGLHARWTSRRKYRVAETLTVIVNDVQTNGVLLQLLTRKAYVSDPMLEFFNDDLKADARAGLSRDGTTGNFENLRIVIDDVEREITSLSLNFNRDPLHDLERRQDEAKDDEMPVSEIVHVWVAWGTSQPSVDDRFHGVYIHADGVETSEVTPRHLGGEDGLDVMQEIKDQYDVIGLNYNADSFSAYDASTNPQGLIGHPNIRRRFFRLRKGQDLEEFTTRVYKSFGLIPFVNPSGELEPKFTHLLQDVDPTTLPEVTDDDVAEPVTFDFRGTAAITVLQGSYDQSYPEDPLLNSEWAADLIRSEEVELPEEENDRVSDLGRKVHRVDLGVESRFGITRAKIEFRHLATETFDRFGDGPIFGRLVGSGTGVVDGLEPGDWFRLTVSNYPVFTTGARDGSTIVAQAIETRRDPEGPTVKFLTGGPDDQPLAAPTVSASLDADRPNHDVEVTISGLPADADRWRLQSKVGSDPWETIREGESATTVTVVNHPSDTTVQFRALVTARDRIRSEWSTVASVTTNALTAPSSLVTEADGHGIRLSWTEEETEYDLIPSLEGTDVLTDPLPEGTTAWEFAGLAASTQYTVGIRYVDPYGGESATSTTTETTEASAVNLPHVAWTRVRQGRNSSARTFRNDLPEPDPAPNYATRSEDGFGVELEVETRGEDADVIVEYTTETEIQDVDSTLGREDGRVHPVWTNATRTSLGGRRGFINLPLDIDDATGLPSLYYFRVRLEREGREPSSWFEGWELPFTGEWVRLSARPVALQRSSPDPVTVEFLRVEVLPSVTPTGKGYKLRYTLELSEELNVPDAGYYTHVSWHNGVDYESYSIAFNVSDTGSNRITSTTSPHGTPDPFDRSITELSFTIIPTRFGAHGRPKTVMDIDLTESGSGVKATATADGSVLFGDRFVGGSNVTIDEDGDGRPRISASSGGGGASELSDLSDVTSAAVTNRNVLVADGSAYVGRALEAADVQSGTFATGRIPSLDASKIGSGIFGVPRGGTGLSSVTSGHLLTGAGAGNLQELDFGASGGFVRSNGSAWVRSTIQAGDLPSHTHPASAISGGTFSDNYTFGADVSFDNPDGLWLSQLGAVPSSVGAGYTGLWARSGSDTLQFRRQGGANRTLLHDASSLAASNLTGTIASGRLSGSYTGITAVGTLSSLVVSGALRLAHGEGLRFVGGGSMAGIPGNDTRLARIEDSNTPSAPDGAFVVTSGSGDSPRQYWAHNSVGFLNVTVNFPTGSISTSGVVAGMEWQGTAIATPHGGTGQTSYAEADLLIGTSGGSLTKFGHPSSSGRYLRTTASGLQWSVGVDAGDVGGGTFSGNYTFGSEVRVDNPDSGLWLAHITQGDDPGTGYTGLWSTGDNLIFQSEAGTTRTVLHNGSTLPSHTHGASDVQPGTFPSGNFTFQGDVDASGEITAGVSDVRLKTEITRPGSIRDRARAVRVGYYRYTAEAAELYPSCIDPDEERFGLISQDLERITDYATTLAPLDSDHGRSRSGRNYLTYRDRVANAILWLYVQELDDEIHDLRDEIRDLRAGRVA